MYMPMIYFMYMCKFILGDVLVRKVKLKKIQYKIVGGIHNLRLLTCIDCLHSKIFTCLQLFMRLILIQLLNWKIISTFCRSYDQHSEKRRKRGSLFFRKKKDKDKEKEQRVLERVHHVWGSTITQGCCDWCSKQLGTKPQVTCESKLTSSLQVNNVM